MGAIAPIASFLDKVEMHRPTGVARSVYVEQLNPLQ